MLWLAALISPEAASLAVVAGVGVSASGLAAAAGIGMAVVTLVVVADVAVTVLTAASGAAGVVTDWAGEAAVQALSSKTAASSRLINMCFE